jgi:dihydroorotate dehydrogenase (NAD+) catalytic subunit
VAPKGLNLADAGAVVVGPILRQSRAGSQPPRLAENLGGIVLDTGLQNRGISSALSKFARLWPRLGCPVVAQIADTEAEGMARLAEQLNEVRGLAALELLPLTADLAVVRRMVVEVAQSTELPIWVRAPLHVAPAWAEAASGCGASAVVVGQGPPGALFGSGTDEAAPRQSAMRGQVYGPLVFALMLERLAAVAEAELPAALIACGGVHTAEHVRQALAAGASAVQLDSVLWVEPGALGWIRRELAGEVRAGTSATRASDH